MMTAISFSFPFLLLSVLLVSCSVGQATPPTTTATTTTTTTTAAPSTTTTSTTSAPPPPPPDFWSGPQQAKLEEVSNKTAALWSSLNSSQQAQLSAILNNFNANRIDFDGALDALQEQLSPSPLQQLKALRPYLSYLKKAQMSWSGLAPFSAIDLAAFTNLHMLHPDQTQEVFAGAVVDGPSYGARLMEGLANGVINPYMLTLGQKMAINSRMLMASIENMMIHGPLIMTTSPIEGLPSDGPIDWGFRAQLNGTGNLTMLLTGNSHADMITNEVVAAFGGTYKTLDIFTLQGCFLFDVHYAASRYDRYDNDMCVIFAHKLLELVRHKRYDIIFVQTNYDTMGDPHRKVPMADRISKDFQRALDILSEHTNQIFIPMPNLLVNYSTAAELVNRMWNGESLDSINYPVSYHLDRVRPWLDIIDGLKCEKCVWIDWSQSFCTQRWAEKDVCQFFDPVTGLALFYDYLHYSFLGSQKIVWMLTVMVWNLAEEIKQWGLMRDF